MKNVIDDLRTSLEAVRLMISQQVEDRWSLDDSARESLSELYREEGELLDCIKVLDDELSKRLRE